MSYATIANMQARYDSRIIAQLSADDNSGTINTTVVQDMLDDATATINMATIQGSQYQLNDLTALVAAGDVMLIRMNCDLAIRALVERRGVGLSGGLERQVKASEELIEALRKGERVLNITANRAADTPAMILNSACENANIQPLSSIPFFGGPQGTPTTSGQYGSV